MMGRRKVDAIYNSSVWRFTLGDGESKDIELVFDDGTKRVFKWDDVNGHWAFGDRGNALIIQPDGEINLIGTARVWKCVKIFPENVSKPASNPPAAGEYQGYSSDRFDRGTEQQVYFQWTVPNDYCGGDNSVRGRYGFFVENPPSGSGDEAVAMGFEYKKVSDGDVFDFTGGTSSGVITETIADGETAYTWHETSEGTCNTTGWSVGDEILFRFYRDATNASDTYDNEASASDNDVWVSKYHLEYLTDKLGSVT